jgi:hypothetical protein
MALNRKSGGQFDFDVSYLSQSPCKFCKNRNKLPLCFKDCKTLEKFNGGWRTEFAGAIAFRLMKPIRSYCPLMKIAKTKKTDAIEHRG